MTSSTGSQDRKARLAAAKAAAAQAERRPPTSYPVPGWGV